MGSMLNVSVDYIKPFVCFNSNDIPVNFLFMSTTDTTSVFSRIKNELEAQQRKREWFCLAVGCKQESYSQNWTHWEKRGFPSKRIATAATVLGVSIEWLATGSGAKHPLSINAMLPGLSSDIAIESNVSHGPTIHGKVPLISWVQAGHALEVVDLLHPGDGFEWIDTTCQIKAHTYALRVQGDSMTPDFPHGCIIVVEPELDPLPGDFVIAKNGDDEATFKQLIKDGADYYLKPLNERYPIKPLGSYRVIGVVRELVRRFR
jgi:SOS-response transcriptional repressor LexA